MTTSLDWDSAYTPGATPPPWDIGRPQQAFVRLADRGLLRGRLLDAGCGTGENALLAADRGAQVTGIDIAARAIAMARDKAAERCLTARFEVADVLDLGQLGMTFDTVIDGGVFHLFDERGRARYAASLSSVLRPGGYCYLICSSDRQPAGRGLPRIRQDQLRAAFSDGWSVTSIEASAYEVRPEMMPAAVPAWLAAIRRI